MANAKQQSQPPKGQAPSEAPQVAVQDQDIPVSGELIILDQAAESDASKWQRVFVAVLPECWRQSKDYDGAATMAAGLADASMKHLGA